MVLLNIFKYIQLSLSYSSETCQKLNNITAADLDSVPRDVPIEDLPDKFKCYCKCLLKDASDDDGKLDVELALKTLNYNNREKLEKCKNLYDHMETKSCNYATFVFSCLHVD